MKKQTQLAAAAMAIFAAGALVGQAENAFARPSTLLHVVTVKWKADSTAEQQSAAIDGIKTMAAAIPGIKSVWIKKLKVQPADFNTAFAIEFENKAAFDVYTDAPAHKEWEKQYLPIREESATHDLTN